MNHVESINCEDWSTAELVRHLIDNNLVSDSLFISNVARIDLGSDIDNWDAYFGRIKRKCLK